MAGSDARAATIVDSADVPTGMDSAYTATSTVGSTRAAIVMCRLEPMPPNAVPDSRPSRARAAVPSSSSDTTTNRSSGMSGSVGVPTSGTRAQTIRLETISTRGAAAIRGPVPAARSGSLAISLRTSRHGWPMPAPARPSMRARVWRITPTSRGVSATAARTCTTSRRAMAAVLTRSPPAGRAAAR